MGRGGGGGGLRILPKKSWNVYNKDNIKKVRDDEAAHAREEAQKAARALRGDAEFRLEAMRNVAGERAALEAAPASEARGDSAAARAVVLARARRVTVDDAPPAGMEVAAPKAPEKHVNLFDDAERDMSDFLKKQIEENEKKKKEIDALKRICPDNFFAHTVLDPETGRAPWYSTALSEQEAAAEVRDVRVEKAASSKSMLDPLAEMNAALGKAERFAPAIDAAVDEARRRATLVARGAAPPEPSARARKRNFDVPPAGAAAAAAGGPALAPVAREEMLLRALAQNGYSGEVASARHVLAAPPEAAVPAAAAAAAPAAAAAAAAPVATPAPPPVVEAPAGMALAVVAVSGDAAAQKAKKRRGEEKESKKKDKKHKKKKTKKRSRSAEPPLKSAEELRAERVERERHERVKVARLLDVPVYATAHVNSLRIHRKQ